MKRTHQQYQEPTYTLIGTPLPAFDAASRDDGSYVPIWKQEVVDAQGRKRLHGAFTGGFSAGYFNTVGSKEGWTPSTFTSSRTNRHKDATKPKEQRIEDFMDDEDLADKAEAEKVQTAEGFGGLGSTEGEKAQRNGLMGLFRTQGEGIGVKLLKKMGWKEGQGIGPKVRRAARSEIKMQGEHVETHLFAPENTSMVSFVRKVDHKGLGFDGETMLGTVTIRNDTSRSDDEEAGFGTSLVIKPKKKKIVPSSIGIGVLNDTGSDDEDPYEVGPKISYNRIIGGDKKKKKVLNNSSLKPVFISKKVANAKITAGFRKCHDGRLPLDGFVLATNPNVISSLIPQDNHPPPVVPEGWKSARIPSTTPNPTTYTSSADLSKASKHDPKSRAAILGETALPSKSVFDFLSTAARDRLVSASGKTNLPTALNEVPAGYALTPEERDRELASQIPKLDPATAQAALNRSTTGFTPYSDDSSKQDRYRTYLEMSAGHGNQNAIPSKPLNMSKSDWLKELSEFSHCANIFKPMSSMMASRFTTSTDKSTKPTDAPSSGEALLKAGGSSAKVEDPAEQAAKMGMFGGMTRSRVDFYPTRLLCKRFGVRPPEHVLVDPGNVNENGGNATNERDLDLVGKKEVEGMMREHWDGVNERRKAGGQEFTTIPIANEPEPVEQTEKIEVIEPDRNEALEKEKAGMEVFKAIFGDSDDDEG